MDSCVILSQAVLRRDHRAPWFNVAVHLEHDTRISFDANGVRVQCCFTVLMHVQDSPRECQGRLHTGV